MKEITQEEILELLLKRGLTIEKVIDAVVDVNGIIGVGLISLGDKLQDYVHYHPKARLTPRLDLTLAIKLNT
jgi:hypothetical protein